MPATTADPGFTLAELLIVLGVLGVLLALGVPAFLNWRSAAQIQDAQTLIRTELDRARLSAKRLNAPRAVTWTATTFNGRDLHGVTITETPTTLTYQPPYGTLSADGGALPAYTLTLKSGQRSGSLRVAGVFGRVVAQQMK